MSDESPEQRIARLEARIGRLTDALRVERAWRAEACAWRMDARAILARRGVSLDRLIALAAENMP